jgi:hypothetical protein
MAVLVLQEQNKVAVVAEAAMVPGAMGLGAPEGVAALAAVVVEYFLPAE